MALRYVKGEPVSISSTSRAGDGNIARVPARGVPAVERAIAILDALATASEPLGLAALAARLRLPKSSVLGLCVTLARSGLLQRNADRTYRLGVRLVDFAHAYLAKLDITTEFVQILDTLEDMSRETIVLSVLDGADVVYVACRNGTHGLSLNYRIGMRLPASCTASGKAQLSALPRAAIDALLPDDPLETLTRHSLATLDALRADLAATRERGFALDNEETREGMCCVGAPVVDAEGRAVAAVAISLLKIEYDTETYHRAVDAVRRLAIALSRRLAARV
ncbi:MAG: IclR family transcriptional regulator BlcR [Candidatus Velthaea sp.]